MDPSKPRKSTSPPDTLSRGRRFVQGGCWVLKYMTQVDDQRDGGHVCWRPPERIVESVGKCIGAGCFAKKAFVRSLGHVTSVKVIAEELKALTDDTEVLRSWAGRAEWCLAQNEHPAALIQLASRIFCHEVWYERQ